MRTEPIIEALRAAVGETCEVSEEVAIAFSGGLDSTVIAALAGEFARVKTYTVGYPSYQDMKNAQEATELLGLPWTPIELDDSLLLGEAGSLLRQFPTLDPVTLSFEVPLWILLGRCYETVVLAGQGADELFGGYARYEQLGGAALREAMDKDLELLVEETIPREDKMARLWGKELRLPYCHAQVLSSVLPISPQVRRGPRRKEALRMVAQSLGLPRVLVERPKKAVQYGSGVMMRLKALAKGRGERVADLLGSLKEAR